MPFFADIPPDTVVVTASRQPEQVAQSAASVTVIDETRLDRLAPPLIDDVLRLAPSTSVSTSGPAGSLTQVRIRGAEANHTLLFIDGIRANDPAAGNEPRFELLNGDLASTVEIVRGPQSALWGSEAIGGVVSVRGANPGSGTQALAEAGSAGFRRFAARSGFGNDDRGLTFGVVGQRADGIDAFDGSGDRDGYRNLGGRLAGRWTLTPALAIGGSGFALAARSQFDGYDPLTFLHADTRDESRNRLRAGRIFADLGDRQDRYLSFSAGLLASSNRNFLDDDIVNRTRASRRKLSAEGGIVIGRHRLTVAAEGEREEFRADDVAFGGATDQRQTRDHRSLTAEWTAELNRLRTDIAIRHDIFDRFRDATTVRGSALVTISPVLTAALTYGEGIAQPTFFDLYGFFPGSFAGNPGLKPERSRGAEASLRYAGGTLDGSITLYRQRLRDEIVGTYDPDTFLSSTINGTGSSRRRGIELEAGYRPRGGPRWSATYAFLNAREPGVADGLLREQRRPRHSASLAVDGDRGRLIYGASAAYVGGRVDTDFDQFPAQRLRLHAYTLVNARLGWRITPGAEVSVRFANLLDKRYVDVIGYRTQGRSVNVGIRLAPRP